MGLDLSNLSSRTASLNVEFMGETAKVKYDPTYLTQETLGHAEDGNDEKFVEFFTGLVKDWDVTNGKKKVPLTAAGLKGVPLLFLRTIFQRVMEDRDVAEQGKASSAT